MPFDNEAFTKWLQEFEVSLMDAGMPQRQAMKYRGEYYNNAVAYFAAGRSPDDAAVIEFL